MNRGCYFAEKHTLSDHHMVVMVQRQMMLFVSVHFVFIGAHNIETLRIVCANIERCL